MVLNGDFKNSKNPQRKIKNKLTKKIEVIGWKMSLRGDE